MSNKKSFVLYNDTYESIKGLNLKEKGSLLEAIFDYSIKNKTKKLSPTTEMAFSFIKQQLDRDTYKWIEIRKKRKLAGSKGGKMRVANQANATFAKQTKQDQANQAVNVNANVNVTGITSKEVIRKGEPSKGNILVNTVMEEFKSILGFSPTDRKPRFQAYNLVRRLQRIIKDNGKTATDEITLKAIKSYFKWLQEQDWFEMVQTLDACRRKTDIFVRDFKLKG